MTHIIYSLDADRQSVTVDGFGPGGQRATGRLTVIDATTTRTTLTIRRPDGRELRMRDVTESSTPDAYVASGEVWNEGEWVPTDAVEWRRHTDPSPCR